MNDTCIGNVSICQRVQDVADWVYEAVTDFYDRIVQVVSACFAAIAKCWEEKEAEHTIIERGSRAYLSLTDDVEAHVERFTSVDELDEGMRQDLEGFEQRLNVLDRDLPGYLDFMGRHITHFIRNVRSKNFSLLELPNNCVLYFKTQNPNFRYKVADFRRTNLFPICQTLYWSAAKSFIVKVYILKALPYRNRADRDGAIPNLLVEGGLALDLAKLVAEYAALTPEDCILAPVQYRIPEPY